jgi:murein DD-endopeptidase MepM/ murein hydrolase activator NlpD
VRRSSHVATIALWVAAGWLAGCHRASDSPASREAHDVSLARDSRETSGRVPANATLEMLLRQNDVSADLAGSVIAAVRKVFNPRDLRAGETYRFTRTLDGLLREFRYPIDPDRFLRVVFHTSAAEGESPFDVEVVPVPKTVELAGIDASISRDHSSIVGAFDAYGENVQLALKLAEIFGGEVDFNSDLQPGDRIQVLFERVTREGGPSSYGDVKAAVLSTGGRDITAIAFADPDGKVSYYDEQGRSLKRQFLHSPLPFEPRVTSRFSYRRVNPVYGDVRAHLGVDYGAPVGTAVMAVASGVVESAGWAGDAGRLIKLRHSGGYETEYLHLSAFAPGIRAGAHVEQGQLIGRVGMTGAATGPHLDYRILKNGVHVNPLLELSRMPPGEPLRGADLDRFSADRVTVLAQLRDQVAAFDAAHPAPSASAPRPK